MDWLRIDVVYSTQHWIVPRILIVVLILFGAFILIWEGKERVKAGGSFVPKFNGKFFAENYDKIKFWGCIVMTVAYFFLLDKIGFTVCSIIFLFLFNTLFAGVDRMKNVKYHITSLIISAVATLIVSITFGTIFAITLPKGICTIEIPALSLIIY